MKKDDHNSKPGSKRDEKRLRQSLLLFFILTVAAFIFSFLISNLLATKRQYAAFYEEKIKTANTMLSQFVAHAVVPFAENDVLTLNRLLKEAGTVHGLLYIAIADEKNVVRAHTDSSKVGLPVERPADSTLELSKPMTFMKRRLGSVYAGFSRHVINDEVSREISGSVRPIFYLGIAMLMLLVGATFFLWIPLKRELTREEQTPQPAESEPPTNETVEKTTPLSLIDSTEGEEIELLNQYTEGIKRTQVTVLFAGIKGFKAYTETRDPQEVLNDLNQYLSIATGPIIDFGGYIDKFIGDAVIAVFGNTPVWLDHSERAVSAAVAVQEALQQAAGNGNPLLSKVGIGISSGVVLSGNIGPEEKKTLTFIGESFKVAYSLNVMAGPGEIIMSRDVYESVEQKVSVEPIAPREMAQRTEPWENFRLIKLIDRKDYNLVISR